MWERLSHQQPVHVNALHRPVGGPAYRQAQPYPLAHCMRCFRLYLRCVAFTLYLRVSTKVRVMLDVDVPQTSLKFLSRRATGGPADVPRVLHTSLDFIVSFRWRMMSKLQ